MWQIECNRTMWKNYTQKNIHSQYSTNVTKKRFTMYTWKRNLTNIFYFSFKQNINMSLDSKKKQKKCNNNEDIKIHHIKFCCCWCICVTIVASHPVCFWPKSPNSYISPIKIILYLKIYFISKLEIHHTRIWLIFAYLRPRATEL